VPSRDVAGAGRPASFTGSVARAPRAVQGAVRGRVPPA